MWYQRDVRLRSILLFLEVLLTAINFGRDALTFGLHAEFLSKALLPHRRQYKPSTSAATTLPALLQLLFLLLCNNPLFLPLKIHGITPNSNHNQHGLRSRPTHVQLINIFMIPLKEVLPYHENQNELSSTCDFHLFSTPSTAK